MNLLQNFAKINSMITEKDKPDFEFKQSGKTDNIYGLLVIFIF